MTCSPGARVPLFLIAMMLVLSAPRVDAQGSLSPALWQEDIRLDVTVLVNESTSFTGSDPESPEPRTEQLSGSGYDVTGSVRFGAAAPPVGVAEVTWAISGAGAALDLNSQVNINFAARVVETATPPVEVSGVPVHLTATGSVDVTEVFGSRATSFFRFQAIGTTVLIQETLDIDGNPEGSTPISDAFVIDETNPIPPGAVILIDMSATASMGTVSTDGATTGSAVGMVDPVIEVADEMIPGTSSSYRDFFAIEFSPGYDAQTPVERMTFGDIKRRLGRN